MLDPPSGLFAMQTNGQSAAKYLINYYTYNGGIVFVVMENTEQVVQEAQGEIYHAFCEESGKGYVGQTKYTSQSRWKEHVDEADSGVQKGCRYLNNAIRRYGADAFKLTVVWRGPISQLDEMEKHYIKEFNTRDPNGYNLTDGGQGFTGGVMPQEFNDAQSVRKRIHCLDENLPTGVCRWVTPAGVEGYLVKVPRQPWAYFCDTNMTKEQRRTAAIAYREHLVAGGKAKPTRTKKAGLGFVLPKYVYYKSTQCGFSVEVPSIPRKSFVGGDDLNANVVRAMKHYNTIVSERITVADRAKAQAIIDSLDE